jgi:hypothetical protein
MRPLGLPEERRPRSGERAQSRAGTWDAAIGRRDVVVELIYIIFMI